MLDSGATVWIRRAMKLVAMKSGIFELVAPPRRLTDDAVLRARS
jgi:hypothetical protein